MSPNQLSVVYKACARQKHPAGWPRARLWLFGTVENGSPTTILGDEKQGRERLLHDEGATPQGDQHHNEGYPSSHEVCILDPRDLFKTKRAQVASSWGASGQKHPRTTSGSQRRNPIFSKTPDRIAGKRETGILYFITEEAASSNIMRMATQATCNKCFGLLHPTCKKVCKGSRRVPNVGCRTEKKKQQSSRTWHIVVAKSHNINMLKIHFHGSRAATKS